VTLSYEQFLLIFGVLVVIGLLISFEVAAVLGVLGVIGPKRLNYARIIPMVDFTARVVSRMLT